jgi:hypothetical protein
MYVLTINIVLMLLYSGILATSFSKPVTVIRFDEECLDVHDNCQPLSNRDYVKVILYSENLQNLLYNVFLSKPFLHCDNL